MSGNTEEKKKYIKDVFVVDGQKTEDLSRVRICFRSLPKESASDATQGFFFPAYLVRQPESRRDGKPFRKIKAVPELRRTRGGKWQLFFFFDGFFLNTVNKNIFVLLTNIQKNIKNISIVIFFEKVFPLVCQGRSRPGSSECRRVELRLLCLFSKSSHPFKAKVRESFRV